MMDNVQKHNNCINIPSSQTFRTRKDVKVERKDIQQRYNTAYDHNVKVYYNLVDIHGGSLPVLNKDGYHIYLIILTIIIFPIKLTYVVKIN
jgi:hypothetical protein